MRPLVAVLLGQLVLASILLILVATGTLNPFDEASSNEGDPKPARAVKTDRFDEDRAWSWLRRQVALGPRPAGSRQSRKLAAQIRRALPGGRYQSVPGGLRNVVGVTPGRDPDRRVVVGAHYDTKDIPGFVGAFVAASWTAGVL